MKLELLVAKAMGFDSVLSFFIKDEIQMSLRATPTDRKMMTRRFHWPVCR